MADINMKDFVDALTADTSPESTDLVYVRTSAGNRKMTVQNLLNGIGSLAIKGRDGGDIGGYLMDKADDAVSIINNDNLNFGTGDFSIETYFQVNNISGNNTLFNKGSLGSGLGYSLQVDFLNNFISLSFTDAVTGDKLCNLISTSAISINTTYHLVVVVDRDGNAIAYLNGVLTGSAVNISAYGASISTITTAYIGRNFASGFFGGKIYSIRLYNKALTATEIANIYNNGRPDLYKLPYSDTAANQTSLTSGTLTIGKRYRLKDFIAGDDFTNVGAASNADGVEFIATGTTPTTWTNSSEVIPIGCVAEYLPHNAGSLGWIESSGNQLSGSTSGSPICLTKESRPPHYRDIRKTIAANTNTTLTSIVPRGYKIVSIRAKGSDSLADIKIGSASAGEQIVAATTTSSTTPKLLTLAATANDAYSESADVTLYARHDTSASGKTMDLIFHFEKVGN